MIKVEEKISIFKDKKIVVVGLARSGTGAANLLCELGAKVIITDKKSRGTLETYIKKLLPSVNVITNGNPQEVFEEADIIVVSPGVPINIPSLIHARAKSIQIISELELAYQIVTSKELSGKREKLINEISLLPYFIGVTGTNGKSTTTTLIDLMLKESGYQTLLSGNIGNALTEEISKAYPYGLPDFFVTEISSFQLEAIKEFKPRIALILNITPDHLDRYDGINDYINTKARIFKNQTYRDFLILNADDPVIMEVRRKKLEGRSKRPKIFFFSCERMVEGVYFKDGLVYGNSPYLSLPTSHFPLISVDEIKIKGIHNLENAMAASLAALIAGCSNQAVKKVLKDFPGLEHRLEFVDEVKGVKFINDSKGTNVGAVAKSLESFRNVILIMGGRDKGGDFSVLREMIKTKVKLLILLGEAKEKIEKAIGGLSEICKVRDLNEAVELSISRASPGDTVLLSPGCASFDMFMDFEDRGRKFKEAVRMLLK